MSRFRSGACAGADFTRLLEVWGNGDADRGFFLFYDVTMRLVHGRLKHPVFAPNPSHALEVLSSECRELVQAVEDGPEGRQRDKALDVVATAVRFYGGEWRREIGE